MNAPEPGPEASPFPPRPEEAAFDAPWQARAFAMTVLLHRRGAFDWADWSAALARECAAQGPGSAGYYEAWVRALQAVLVSRGVLADGAAEDERP